MKRKGYTLAKGDRCAYVILDENGGVHNLSRVARVNVAELRQTLSKYAINDLPDAKEIQQALLAKKQRTPESEHKDKSQKKDHGLFLGLGLGGRERSR